MKIDDIEKLWMDDAKIDTTDLGSEALSIPRLHSKWYSLLLAERRIFHALLVKKDDFQLVLEGYFAKTLTSEELAEHNLPPYSDKKILKTDFSKHISTFRPMVELNLKIAMQSDKIDFIKDILKTIHGRSFIIKDAVEWAKFQSGSY